MAKTPAAQIDPTSACVVLRYTGDGRSIREVPARDLTESDLCRLAYRRALTALAPGDPRPDPRVPNQSAVAAIRDELLSRGQFALATEPTAPDEPAPTPEG